MTAHISTEAPLIARLATHLQRPVPAYVRTRARLHLLDWLACVAGARASGIAKRRSGWRLSTRLGNLLEMDDVHRIALLHPGPVLWPTALGGEDRALSDVIDDAVRGYEAMIAVGSTLDAWHYAHFHPTATAGSFGAAAVKASGLALGPDRTAHALALAGSVTGGLWQMRHEVCDGKQWHVDSAIRNGIGAAFEASAGMTGPLFVLEGPQGLYAAMTRQAKPMVLTDGWRVEEVSFKPWAACRHAHPAIDCALELRAAGKLTAPFHIETYADAIAFCDRPHPVTEVDAKFSLQHAVAVIADGREARPEDFTPEAIAALSELRAQVSVAEAPEITARYPVHFGARLNGLELIDTRGDPERPVNEEDIIAKLRTLVAWGGLPASEADRATELALESENTPAIVAMLDDWLS